MLLVSFMTYIRKSEGSADDVAHAENPANRANRQKDRTASALSAVQQGFS